MFIFTKLFFSMNKNLFMKSQLYIKYSFENSYFLFNILVRLIIDVCKTCYSKIIENTLKI